jgi:hypothetical protein
MGISASCQIETLITNNVATSAGAQHHHIGVLGMHLHDDAMPPMDADESLSPLCRMCRKEHLDVAGHHDARATNSKT